MLQNRGLNFKNELNSIMTLHGDLPQDSPNIPSWLQISMGPYPGLKPLESHLPKPTHKHSYSLKTAAQNHKDGQGQVYLDLLHKQGQRFNLEMRKKLKDLGHLKKMHNSQSSRIPDPNPGKKTDLPQGITLRTALATPITNPGQMGEYRFDNSIRKCKSKDYLAKLEKIKIPKISERQEVLVGINVKENFKIVKK